jgi:UDP-N-acetyl-D-mannosaminuronate dehydrogenase
VHPGAGAESGLKWKQDFFVGYSPERINPGDKEHTLTKILKIVSGDTPETLDKVAKALYERSSCPACTAPAASRPPRPPRSSRTPSAT